MTSFVNILLVILDHSLYKDHLRKVYPSVRRTVMIYVMKSEWRRNAPIKISLVVLYSIVCICGLTGNILDQHLNMLLFLNMTGQLVFFEHKLKSVKLTMHRP